jgi:hypothetical protein
MKNRQGYVMTKNQSATNDLINNNLFTKTLTAGMFQTQNQHSQMGLGFPQQEIKNEQITAQIMEH